MHLVTRSASLASHHDTAESSLLERKLCHALPCYAILETVHEVIQPLPEVWVIFVGIVGKTYSSQSPVIQGQSDFQPAIGI